MNTTHQQSPIESQTGPDDIIHTEIDTPDARKDHVQEQLEGAEPSEDETEVNPEDARISRSEYANIQRSGLTAWVKDQHKDQLIRKIVAPYSDHIIFVAEKAGDVILWDMK